MAEWVTYDPNNSVSLEDWLVLYKPSVITNYQASWLCVRSESHDTIKDVEAAIMDWDKLIHKRAPTEEDVDEIALKHNILVGKWLVFVDSPRVDQMWSLIATATMEGRLGGSAKVSPKSQDPSHVICIYTDNFLEVSEVQKVRLTLRDLGLQGKLNYKPDIYTYLNIYAKNPWGLRASKYCS